MFAPYVSARIRSSNLVATFALLAWLAGSSAAQAADPSDFVWIEGEAPAAINVKPNISGWGNKQFLSGEQWLQVSVDADKVDKDVPGDAVSLRYEFTLKNPGNYEVWDRIGYEFARSPFRWRVDGEGWTTVGPEVLTTDLMELQMWNEVAWLKLGARDLKPGRHTLEIELPKTKNRQGKPERILYASDAICIHRGPFFPYSRFKPDDEARSGDDRKAESNVFALPDPAAGGARASVALAGLWEVCRHDEQQPGETAAPIRDFPAHPRWTAIAVPGDKNTLRPDLVFAHRLWYRTRVRVPESCAGRSFSLVFPQNNLNTTVFVNGVYCGFNKNPYARFAIDVTPGIKPGVNEVWVGIKDAWYGYSTNPDDPLKLRKRFNLPLQFSHQGFQDLAYPIWGAFQSGLLATPELVAAGPVYAADVFCKPSVARQELSVELTLANPSKAGVTGEVRCEAVNAKTGAVEKTLEAKPFTLAGGKEQIVRVAGGWSNPKLWWPDEPQMYRLRATVSVGGKAFVGGKAVDVSETPFGFREWTIAGADFKLNGVVCHLWADTQTGRTKEEWLANHRKWNERMMRFWGTSWHDLTPDAALDFFDANGVVVRRSGMLDGEAIGYMAVENDPALKKKYGTDIKIDLMDNWRDQMVAQVKGERNHPSVMTWSIENEWLFINCINLYGGLMDKFEAQVKRCSDAVIAADPTRPTMTDGGGANKDQSMPIHGNHYVFSPSDTRYPAIAYEPNVEGGGRGRWIWDQKRPRFIGEDYFANGINPADYAMFGGEGTFVGKAQARPAAGLIYRMLTEGYRWAGYSAWHFWMTQDEAVDQYGSNAPLAVFCREWDWTFGEGEKVRRTFGIFNDTRHGDPVTFAWSLTVDGAEVSKESREYRVAPGTNQKFVRTIEMPMVLTRTEGKLALTLAVKGKEVFRDVKDVSILPDARSASGFIMAPNSLLVHDPKGTVAPFLKDQGVAFTPLESLNTLPEAGKVLIVGKDALDPRESASSRLAAYASAGRTVIVLEQTNPLRYQGLPAEMEPAPTRGKNDFGQTVPLGEGRIAFGEDMNHPVLRGLKQKDFFTWGPDEVVYRGPYVKPTRGGKSLVQCGPRLTHSALAEVPAGKGLLLVSQLAIGEKLATNAVARRLLTNLIEYGGRYKLEYRQVAVASSDNPALPRVLDAIGLQYRKVEGPLQAIGSEAKLAIVEASPANLKLLAGHRQAVEAFTRDGGYLVLHGLTSRGLADYNAIVGFDHMIRPFRRERVTLPAVKHPLTSGLTSGDVVMLSGERIFPWTSDEYVASDVFTHVVDYDEVAPFAKFPSDYYDNMVNGFVSADAWKFVYSFDLKTTPKPEWDMVFPKEQELVELTWIGNAFYHLVTKVEMTFDGRSDDVAVFATKPNNEPQTFAIDPPRKVKKLHMKIADWEKVAGKGDVVGVDDLALKAKRPPEFYRNVRPLLNVGGLMEYPRGAGGIVLCNLAFKDGEAVPVNKTKKQTILATILRNLKAPFSGGGAVIAGSNLRYDPLDLSKQANQYRDEKGWFGDKRLTFAALPTGRQSFAGVPFVVYDFPTSPVPTVVMLAGPNVPNKLPTAVRGIPVARKADALFFLQAARIDQRRPEHEIREKKTATMARYVVHYADGKTVDVPIRPEIDVDDYRQRQPAAIPGAQLGWVRPYEGTDLSAVAYVKQWDNPRPDVAIESVDLVSGPDQRGVLALIALTAASANP